MHSFRASRHSASTRKWKFVFFWASGTRGFRGHRTLARKLENFIINVEATGFCVPPKFFNFSSLKSSTPQPSTNQPWIPSTLQPLIPSNPETCNASTPTPLYPSTVTPTTFQTISFQVKLQNFEGTSPEF